MGPGEVPENVQRHSPFCSMGRGLRHGVGEAQLEVLAAQRVFSVVVDQGVHAEEVQVGRQVEVSEPPLGAGADPTVLDSPSAPETHTTH